MKYKHPVIEAIKFIKEAEDPWCYRAVTDPFKTFITDPFKILVKKPFENYVSKPIYENVSKPIINAVKGSLREAGKEIAGGAASKVEETIKKKVPAITHGLKKVVGRATNPVIDKTIKEKDKIIKQIKDAISDFDTKLTDQRLNYTKQIQDLSKSIPGQVSASFKKSMEEQFKGYGPKLFGNLFGFDMSGLSKYIPSAGLMGGGLLALLLSRMVGRNNSPQQQTQYSANVPPIGYRYKL